MLYLANFALHELDSLLTERSQHGESTCQSFLAEPAVANGSNDGRASYLIAHCAACTATMMQFRHERFRDAVEVRAFCDA